MSIQLLFADDSITIQKVVELAFENEDVNVTAVKNGEEALKKLDSFSPDIIVSDIGMPGMGGLELCKQIRSIPAVSEIPVLLLRSDSYNNVSDEEMDEVGANAYLTKPFKSEELVNKVKSLTLKDDDLDLKSLPDFSRPEDGHELINDTDFGDDLLVLKPQNEIGFSEHDPKKTTQDLFIEVIAVKKDGIEKEDLNLSGLLSDEEIVDEEKELAIVKKDIDELFSSDDDLEWLENEEAFDLKEAHSTGAGPSHPSKIDISGLLSKEKIEQGFRDAVKDLFEESNKKNEKIVKEKLDELLKEITPRILTSIEKVVWEIVPDLAETLIKKEIEKIRTGL